MTAPDDDRLNLLLVDDRPENLLALEAILDPLGQRLVFASSGTDALKRLLADEFALILLDVQMPGLDGFETAALVKRRERTRHVPVIFLTAIDFSPQHALRAYETGAADFLFKPFDAEMLRSKVTVFCDLHRLRRQAERVAVRHLELDRAKTSFLSAVSHELRTPLTSIRGYVEMLADGAGGPLTDEQRSMLEIVHRNSGRLLALVEDLLTLSRMDSGTFAVTLAPTELGPLIANVVETVGPAVAERSLHLEVDQDPAPPVLADAVQLERALLNLLSNAVKFTPDGGNITLSARTRPGDVLVTVRDSGVGIPLEDQGRLFDRFFRSSLAEELAIQGTGLGLTIVKHVVEHHGGTIAVESAPGEGTAITFNLPLAGAGA